MDLTDGPLRHHGHDIERDDPHIFKGKGIGESFGVALVGCVLLPPVGLILLLFCTYSAISLLFKR